MISIRIAEAHAEVHHELLSRLHTQVGHNVQATPRFIDARTCVALLKGGGDAQREAKVRHRFKSHGIAGTPFIGHNHQCPSVRLVPDSFFLELHKHLSSVGHGGHRFGRHKAPHVQGVKPHTQQGPAVREFVLGGDGMRPSLNGIPWTFHKMQAVIRSHVHKIHVNVPSIETLGDAIA